MYVREVNEMSACDLKTKVFSNGLPNELEGGRVFHWVLLEIMGQYFAICPSISSRKLVFCCAVRRLVAATDLPSSTKPLNGWALVFFCHVTPSAKNGVKLLSKDNV